MEAWHFIRKDRCMRFDDQDLIKVGQTYRVKGEPRLCEHGLHASKRATDALVYAPGPIICRVRLGGTIIEDTYTVLWMEDATEALHNYARWCALSIAHLWDMPHSVRQYLETGDEISKAATRAAANADANTSANTAASAAANTAWNASNTAAWAAARAAANATANTAANIAARTAARAAANAAWDAANMAAWDAALARQNIELETRLNTIHSQNKS